MLGCVSWIDPGWTLAGQQRLLLIWWHDVIARSVYLKSLHNRRINSHHSRRWLFIRLTSSGKHSYSCIALPSATVPHIPSSAKRTWCVVWVVLLLSLSNNNNNLILKWTQQFSTILFFSSVYHRTAFSSLKLLMWCCSWVLHNHHPCAIEEFATREQCKSCFPFRSGFLISPPPPQYQSQLLSSELPTGESRPSTRRIQ